MSSKKPTPIELRFKKSALKEFRSLDGSVKPRAAAQLLKIQQNPLVGEPCGNKMGIDLTGYRRIYFHDKRMRIIWEVRGNRVVIWAIGPRDKGEVYKLIEGRIDEPEVKE